MTIFKHILVSLVLAAPALEVNPDMAYLVIAATVADEDKEQPTWIGLGNIRGVVHIPANQYIVSIRPGYYRIDHIDFQKNKRSGKGTQAFKQRDRLHFQAGKIYVIAHYKLTHVSGWKYDFSYGDSKGILKEACNRSPEIFNEFPVNTFDKIPEFKLSC